MKLRDRIFYTSIFLLMLAFAAAFYVIWGYLAWDWIRPSTTLGYLGFLATWIALSIVATIAQKHFRRFITAQAARFRSMTEPKNTGSNREP